VCQQFGPDTFKCYRACYTQPCFACAEKVRFAQNQTFTRTHIRILYATIAWPTFVASLFTFMSVNSTSNQLWTCDSLGDVVIGLQGGHPRYNDSTIGWHNTFLSTLKASVIAVRYTPVLRRPLREAGHSNLMQKLRISDATHHMISWRTHGQVFSQLSIGIRL
jgi:hypothetical protein